MATKIKKEHMFSFPRYRYRRIFLAFAATTILFFAIIWSINYLTLKFESKQNQIIKNLEQSLNAVISFKKKSLSLDKLTVDHIKILGTQVQAYIPHLEIKHHHQLNSHNFKKSIEQITISSATISSKWPIFKNFKLHLGPSSLDFTRDQGTITISKVSINHIPILANTKVILHKINSSKPISIEIPAQTSHDARLLLRQIRAHGHINAQAKKAELEINLPGLNLERWPEMRRFIPSFNHLKSSIKFYLAWPQPNKIEIKPHIDLPQLAINHSMISTHGMIYVPIQISFQGIINPRHGTAIIRHGQWKWFTQSRHPITTTFAIKYGTKHNSRKNTLAIAMTLPRSACQHLLEAMPYNLSPKSKDFSASGSIMGQLYVALNPSSGDITDAKLIKGFQDCKLNAYNAYYEPQSFIQGHKLTSFQQKSPFVFVYPQIIRIPHHAINSQIGKYFVAAEDGRFFQHKGFDFERFISALQQNIKRHRADFGASTITMQTAKNLYLSSTKSLSRKIDELILTHYLEQRLSKQEILGLYLNNIEFGPGLFGIFQAAKYYFDKVPIELTIKEIAFLTSLLPAPRKRYLSICRKKLSSFLEGLVENKLNLFYQAGLISHEQLSAAKTESLHFATQNLTLNGHCPKFYSHNTPPTVLRQNVRSPL